VEADRRLRHISLLNNLRIADLAETVNHHHLAGARAAESLVSHLGNFVAGIEDDLLDDRDNLLLELNKALDSLNQHD